MRRCTFWRLLKIFTPSTWYFLRTPVSWRTENVEKIYRWVSWWSQQLRGVTMNFCELKPWDRRRKRQETGKESVGLSTSFVLLSSVWSLPVPAVPWQRSPILNLLLGSAWHRIPSVDGEISQAATESTENIQLGHVPPSSVQSLFA